MGSFKNSRAERGVSRSEPVWRSRGEDPDYRFSLANERTFLAWIRTALAILAAGVLLDQFSIKLAPPLFVAILSGGLCLLAAFLSLMAYSKWRDYEIAMRHKRALPFSRAMVVLVGIVLSLSLVMTGLILFVR